MHDQRDNREWREDEHGLLGDAGDVGGDVQVGPALFRRFWIQAISLYELIEVYAYPARDSKNGRIFVQLQWIYTICTDRADPGGTEQWADYYYEDAELPSGEAGESSASAIEHASEHARQLITGLTVEEFAQKAVELCQPLPGGARPDGGH